MEDKGFKVNTNPSNFDLMAVDENYKNQNFKKKKRGILGWWTKLKKWQKVTISTVSAVVAIILILAIVFFSMFGYAVNQIEIPTFNSRPYWNFIKTKQLNVTGEMPNEAIDKIIDTLELKETYYDGGTKLYKGENLTLVKCNTLAGNKDVYIGNKDFKYEQGYCK